MVDSIWNFFISLQNLPAHCNANSNFPCSKTLNASVQQEVATQAGYLVIKLTLLKSRLVRTTVSYYVS